MKPRAPRSDSPPERPANQRPLDFDLVFCDFAELFRQAPQRGLGILQILLLDESACRARIEFLEQTSHQAQEEGNPCLPKCLTETTDFSLEIQALTEVGIFAAFEAGQLNLERLAELTRSPAALWKVHERLNGMSP